MVPKHSVDVSVVIPVYGSASILAELIAQLEASLEASHGKGNFEVVLVHDFGVDNSWQVIESLAVNKPWLRGIDLRKNVGQHNAIMAGLGVAQGRYIVTMDDDLQHDPADVPRIVASLEEGHDLCYVQFEERHHPLWKRLGSTFNDAVAYRLLKKPKGLYLSPFKGMQRDISNEVLRYEGPFVYLDGLLLQSTANITAIQARHYSRQDGKSGYSLYKSISLWLRMVTSFSVAPLRFVSITGIIASIVGFILALIVFVVKILNPETAVGWASLIITVLLMGGLQLLAAGAIGEYIGRILLTINKRPQYVRRRTVNIDGQTDGHL